MRASAWQDRSALGTPCRRAAWLPSALLTLAMALAGCASDRVPLEPGQARIMAYEVEKTEAHAGDYVSGITGLVPVPGVSIVGFFSSARPPR